MTNKERAERVVSQWARDFNLPTGALDMQELVERIARLLDER